mgnify:CR=1 FL=1
MVEKDIGKVADYQLEEKLKFLRGMCFNNACQLLSGRMVFDLAEQLFDEAIKRNWLEYGKITDNRILDKNGKVVEGVPITLTEKEGREMDKKDEELVI